MSILKINTKNITIRDAMPKDTEHILELWQRVFKYNDHQMMIKKDLFDADENWKVFGIRLMEHQGKLLGTVCIQRHIIQFGQAKLLCGNVGYVSIEPDLQGHGLGTILMRDNSEVLVRDGFPFGRLGGLAGFYSRFGWSPISNRAWHFSTSDVAAGASVIPFSDIVAVDKEKIRPFKMGKDWFDCNEICKSCHQDSFWYEPLDSPFVELQKRRVNDFEIKRWVYEDKGQVKAYIMLANNQHIFDAAWLPDYMSELVALLKYSISQAKRINHEISNIRASLPWDRELMQAVTAASLKYDLVETHGGIGSTMIKVVDLARLTNAFLPELKRRTEELGPLPVSKFIIELTDRDQKIGIDLSDTSVFDVGKNRDKLTLKMGQSDFMHLLIGAELPSRLNVEIQPYSQESMLFIDRLFSLQNRVGP